MTHMHVAGSIHADAVSAAPNWLVKPTDANVLVDGLWSGTVARADDRLHLHFALGKAYDDVAEHEPAFRHYAAGNAIRSAQLGYRSAETSAMVDAIIAACTPEFFAARAGAA